MLNIAKMLSLQSNYVNLANMHVDIYHNSGVQNPPSLTMSV